HRRIDGLIMVPSFIYQSKNAQKTLADLLKQRIPIVGMMSDLSNIDLNIDRVVSDYRDATLEIMTQLLALEHRRIGFVYGIAMANLGEDRLSAYRDSLRDAGLPVDPALIAHCGPTIEDSYQATLQLLQLPDPPTALLAINDLLAVGALRAIYDSKLTVPQDVSLFGYDDIPLAQYLVPRLSTASKDGKKTGREAVRLLLTRLQNPKLARQEIRLPASVILRESIGPAPAR
ncbi:MAG: substrate-binding domain-containing protein, partial [Caldilineaceae bacterium]|nr:substrate-binding domain-containing protein [Caldilineaceae bacterium]